MADQITGNNPAPDQKVSDSGITSDLVFTTPEHLVEWEGEFQRTIDACEWHRQMTAAALLRRVWCTALAGLEELARRDVVDEEEAAFIRETYPELFKDYKPSATLAMRSPASTENNND